MVDGQHHHVSPQYLYQYANHAAWLEDHRRLDNGALTYARSVSRSSIRSAGIGKAIGSAKKMTVAATEL